MSSPRPAVMNRGVVEQLHALYVHPDVDKVVITGKAGAGKTGALIQILLEALDYRENNPGANGRSDVPVPVFLTLSDWDPTEKGLVEWADAVLKRDYGSATTSAGDSIYAELLRDRGRISLFLDGLEEMPPELWDKAVERITVETSLRVVLTARPKAARRARIAFAAQVKLAPVKVTDARDYFLTACDERLHPQLWKLLAEHLNSGNPVPAEVLQTPLMLSLALSTYDREGQDPTDLADRALFPDRKTMEQFLIDQIIPVAYGVEPSHGRHAIDIETATAYLRELATQMDDSRDLKWWTIRDALAWFPPAVIGFLGAAVITIIAIVLGGAAAGLAAGIPLMMALPAIAGWTASYATRLEFDVNEPGPQVVISLGTGLFIGICFAVESHLEMQRYSLGVFAAIGVTVGVLAGALTGLLAVHGNPLVARFRKPIGKDVVFAVPGGALAGLTYGILESSWRGAAVGLIAIAGFMMGIASARPDEHPEQGATPLSSFRADSRGAVVLGITIAVTLVTMFAVVLLERHSVLETLLICAFAAIAAGAIVGPAGSQACAFTLVTVALRAATRLRGQPAKLPWFLLSARGSSADDDPEKRDRLAGFLEDARSRQIVRSAGAIYQFRHARLQDRLSGRAELLDEDDL
ncbi:hypothetical protein OJ998_15940 [Solirubrobacter taibaiensis]|nr:hypothetical protein [Solirubrobacter taibaiensis]